MFLLIVLVSPGRGVGGKCIYKHFMMELFDQSVSENVSFLELKVFSKQCILLNCYFEKQ